MNLVVLQTILYDIPFKMFLLKMKKKIAKFGINYDRHKVQPLVLHILRRSFKKNFFSGGGGYFPPNLTCIALTYTKITYYLTIVIINALNFKMIDLK